MSRATLQESLEKLQECVRDETPRKTGTLWRSVKTKERGALNRGKVLWYQGEVYSDLEYAAAIEYGMSPRRIDPNKKQALSFNWERMGGRVAFDYVNWPGFEGRFMFLKGSQKFERMYAEDIAEDNARLYLGSVDAGRRTVVF